MRVPRSDARGWLLGLALFAAAFWLVDLGVLKNGTPDPLDDLWEYGVAARTLAAGQGLRTQVIHPPLWPLRDSALTVPLLVHGPLVPMLLQPVAARAGPAGLDGAAWLAALFAVLGAVLTARLGARLFGAPAGAAAAALYTLSPLTLRAVHHDLALPLGAMLLVAALDLLLRSPSRPLASGIALGLCYLPRPEMILAAPLFALAAGRGALPLLLGFALAAAPWWIHNVLVTGQPLFNLSSYLVIGYWHRAELSPMRDFALTPAAWPATLRASLPELPAKWIDLFPHALKRCLLAPSGGTGWLALCGLSAAIARDDRRTAGALAFGLAAIPLVVQTLTLYDSRYLVPFLPLWALAAASGAQWLASLGPEWVRRPRAWMGALLLLVLPSIAPALKLETLESAKLRTLLASERAALAALPAAPGPPAPLFSDQPDFVSWTTGRSVIWVTREEYARLPGPGEPNPHDLPVRGAPEAAWFTEAARDSARGH